MIRKFYIPVASSIDESQLSIDSVGFHYYIVEVDGSDILDRIHRLLCRHSMQHFIRPIALLVGPYEYLELAAAITNQYGQALGGLIYPTEYHGLPITLKTSPGIDLAVPLDYTGIGYYLPRYTEPFGPAF